MRVETPGDRVPRLTTLLNSVGEAVSVRTQGSTGNQFFFLHQGSWSVSQNGLRCPGTCTKSNLLDLIKRDERVIIVLHVAVLNIQGTDEQGMLRQPSPDDSVVHGLLARALGDKPAVGRDLSPMVPTVWE